MLFFLSVKRVTHKKAILSKSYLLYFINTCTEKKDQQITNNFKQYTYMYYSNYTSYRSMSPESKDNNDNNPYNVITF